jgi:inhibitor of KinA sporulation pathway (predicted exonuclease)
MSMSKAKKFDKLIVIDLEASCWDTNTGNETVPEGEESEIIEVGVCELDLKTLELGESMGIIVKPTKSRISKFCTQLTSITQEMVDGGVSLAEAMKILREKFQIHKRTMASWGEYDKKKMIAECKDKGIEFPGTPRSCINIKNLMAVSYGTDKELGLDTAAKDLNIPFEGRHHRGVDDAIMIAKIMRQHLRTLRNMNRPQEGIMQAMSGEDAVRIAIKAGIINANGTLTEDYKHE